MPDLIDDGKINNLEYLDSHILFRTHDGETVPVRVEEDTVPPIVVPRTSGPNPPTVGSGPVPASVENTSTPTAAAPLDKTSPESTAAKKASSIDTPASDSSSAQKLQKDGKSKAAGKDKAVPAPSKGTNDAEDPLISAPAAGPSSAVLPSPPNALEESLRIAAELILEEEISKSKAAKKKEKKKVAKAKKAVSAGDVVGHEEEVKEDESTEGLTTKLMEEAQDAAMHAVAEADRKAAEVEAARKAALEAVSKAAAERAAMSHTSALTSPDPSTAAPTVAPEVSAGKKKKIGAPQSAPLPMPAAAPAASPLAPSASPMFPPPATVAPTVAPAVIPTLVAHAAPPNVGLSRTLTVVQPTPLAPPPAGLSLAPPPQAAPLIRPPIFQHLAAAQMAAARPLIVPTAGGSVAPSIPLARPHGLVMPSVGLGQPGVGGGAATIRPAGLPASLPLMPAVMPQGLAQVCEKFDVLTHVLRVCLCHGQQYDPLSLSSSTLTARSSLRFWPGKQPDPLRGVSPWGLMSLRPSTLMTN